MVAGPAWLTQLSRRARLRAGPCSGRCSLMGLGGGLAFAPLNVRDHGDGAAGGRGRGGRRAADHAAGRRDARAGRAGDGGRLGVARRHPGRRDDVLVAGMTAAFTVAAAIALLTFCGALTFRAAADCPVSAASGSRGAPRTRGFHEALAEVAHQFQCPAGPLRSRRRGRMSGSGRARSASSVRGKPRRSTSSSAGRATSSRVGGRAGSVLGTRPRKKHAVPSSHASPSWSANTAGVPSSRVASREIASAPASRNSATGGAGRSSGRSPAGRSPCGPRRPACVSTSRASGSATAGTMLSPDGDGSAPASTAGSDGSSNCTTTSAPAACGPPRRAGSRPRRGTR